MKQIKRIPRWLVLVTLLLASTIPAFAQSDELQFFVRRTFGYGGGDQIQGLFSLEATGPADLASVTFKVDDQVVGTVTSAPFKVSFNTDTYGLGWHTLTAQGQTSSGRAVTAAPRRFEFVSAGTGLASAGRIALPVLGILVIVALGAVAGIVLDTRRSRQSPTPLGAARGYGLMGGTICPKCDRPFARHWWALNAGLSKLDRCPHCGRWSLVRAVPLDQLRAAEAAEPQAAQPASPVAELSPEEKLRRQLDDSRYDSR